MRRRARERERQEKKKKNRRSISERLHATLRRSFRRQHGEKMVCMSGVPGTFGKSNSHFLTQTKRGRGPHNHGKAAVN